MRIELIGSLLSDANVAQLPRKDCWTDGQIVAELWMEDCPISTQ